MPRGAEPIHHSLTPVPLEELDGAPVAFGAITILLGLWLWWMWRRRRARLASPLVRAKLRLSRIEADSPKSLFDQLHAIVSDFIAARAGIAATARTSEELVESLRAAGLEDVAELRAFFVAKDQARFSAKSPDGFDSRRAIEQCRLLINRIHWLTKGRDAT